MWTVQQQEQVSRDSLPGGARSAKLFGEGWEGDMPIASGYLAQKVA